MSWLIRITQLKCEKPKKNRKPKKTLVAIPSLGDVGPKIVAQYNQYKEKQPHKYNLHDWCFFLYDEYYSACDRMMPHSLIRDAGMMKRILKVAGGPYLLYWLIKWACENVDDLSIFMLNSNWLTSWLQQLNTKIEIVAQAQYITQWVTEPEQQRIFSHLCTMAESDNEEAQKLLKGLIAKWQMTL